MSSKTRTRKTRATGTTRSDRTLRSVPDQTTAAPVRTDAEDKLWAALYANPNRTASALSVAAKIGKSTAQKVLAKWAADGSVTRTPGIAEGGRRAADLWAITDTDIAAADDAVDGPVGDDMPADNAPVDPATIDAEATPVEDNPTKPASSDTPAVGATSDTEATTPVDTEDAIEPTEEEHVSATDNGATNDSVATAHDTGMNDADNDGSRELKGERLAPGALRGMVEDHLRDHPSEDAGCSACSPPS